jgi:hypothetical protein
MEEFPRCGLPEDKIDNARFEDLILTRVDAKRGSSSYGVEAEGRGFGFAKAAAVQAGVEPPEVGDRVRLWSYRGSMILGMALRGTVLFYRTEEENQAQLAAEGEEREAKEKKEWEDHGKAELQARYEKLPEAFRHRLDKYRNGPNKSFGWQYESYEMFCCEQAVVYAEQAKKVVSVAMGDTAEVAAYYEGKGEKSTPPTPELRWLFWWNALNSVEYDYDYERQTALMPGMSGDHSGNTHGTAFQLAVIWLSPEEGLGDEGVVKRFGALAPLVGSETYGDSMPEEAPAG